jgi:hypothetical protein
MLSYDLLRQLTADRTQRLEDEAVAERRAREPQSHPHLPPSSTRHGAAHPWPWPRRAATRS